MSRKYRAEQDVAISAWEAGTEIEIRMVVHYVVHPAYEATLEEPGSDAIAEVDRVQFFEIKNGKPSPDECGMAVWIFNRLTEGDEFYGWLLSEAAETDAYHREQYADMMREEMRDERERF